MEGMAITAAEAFPPLSRLAIVMATPSTSASAPPRRSARLAKDTEKRNAQLLHNLAVQQAASRATAIAAARKLPATTTTSSSSSSSSARKANASSSTRKTKISQSKSKATKTKATKSVDDEQQTEQLEDEDDAPTTKLSALQRAALETLSVNELRERLKDNDQIATGNRAQLCERIREAITRGAMPRCPKCQGGRIRRAETDASGKIIPRKGSTKHSMRYECPGSFDDDRFVRCSFAANTITRVPWVVASDGVI
jgi:hypothetical protein